MIFPVLIDSRPNYLADAPAPSSLLLMPAGTTSLLRYLHTGFAEFTHHPLTVVATFDPPPGYEEAIRRESDPIDGVFGVAEFTRRLHAFKPSDWLLLHDARRVPTTRLDLGDIIQGIPADPRWVRHIVALATSPAGTNERVLLDPDGHVSRIQRYYENVTWSFASGVACSLVPLASALLARNLPLTSLPELRAALAGHGVPSRDLFLNASVCDLGEESGLLALNERLVLNRAAIEPPLQYGAGAQIDPTARIQGPVVVLDDVVVEAEAAVIGPAVLGRGCRIGAQATVVQSVIAPGEVVPPQAMVVHRVLASTWTAAKTGAMAPAAPSFVPPPGGWETIAEVDEGRESRPIYPVVKTVVEIALAAMALIVIAPIFILLAILVRLDSRGPVLYGDGREGRRGRLFRCWKFRTMIEGADARQRQLARENQMDGPQFKMKHDPRVTRIGRWLRPLSLDELPQLLNVVVGQMSFVGPRPSPFRENQMCIPWREARLSVLPGITGLWQVCRHDRSYGDFHQWIYYDLLYVRHMSPIVDLKILIATVITLGGRYSVPLDWIIRRPKFTERRRVPREPPRADQAPVPRQALGH